jgi:FecR protein
VKSEILEINLPFDKQRRLIFARLLSLVLLSAAAAHAMVVTIKAQGVEARIASVNGRAVFSGNARPISNLVRGVVVVPGDVIDSRAGGYVTIQLSDGSLVIVQPGSVVVFQDYRNAGSLRELLKITAGRVRVRINHFGGRPNPYRVNSPTASIAVRGTEFSVAVSAAGDTEVVVFEGLVEVASVSHPSRRVLVGAGHGVIIRAKEDVQFFVPGMSNEIGERTKGGRGHDQESFNEADASVAISKPAEDSLRTASGVYERYFDNIVENGETPLPSRFAAFPDAHFDSIENPAYASAFTAIEGRMFFLPSIGGTRENDNVRQLFGVGDPRSVDYSLSPQGSLFVPLPRFRAVVGGRVAYSRDGFQSLTFDDNAGLTGSFFAPGTTGKRAIDGVTTNRLFAASLIAARQFGNDGHTSVGFSVDYFSTRGRLSNTITQTDLTGFSSSEIIKSRSFANRTRLTVGMTRELGGGRKLGLFYRYGFTAAEDGERSRTIGGPRLLNRTSATGHSSEIGFRLRGPFSHRLFYGIESSYLLATIDENARRRGVVNSLIRSNSRRATLGLGLGYVLRPRTVFSFDVTEGVARINDARNESTTSNLLESERKRAFFLSLHAALQADVWRRLFVNGSLLSVTQARVSDLSLYPDRFGRVMTGDGVFQPNGRTRDRFTDYFSNAGFGWRFNRNFLAEYIFSTDFGQTSPRHTLLLRYTFGGGDGSLYR